MAARHDLFIDQGTTYTRDFVYKDAAGAIIPLTNYTAQMMIRKTATASGTPILSKALAVTGAEGKITLSLTDEETQALPAPFDGVYDIEINDVDGGNIVTRLVQGNIRIDPNVTRDDS